MRDARASLERFVPRVSAEWDLDVPGARWRRIDGTLCFVDISGFTNLSEKLARRGRVGAEELTDVLDRVFGNMLRLAYNRGGSLLKFGGDALLLMFEGDDHPVQGASAAVEMRAALRQATEIPTSVGVIRLKMSVGLHTGMIDLFLVGDSHRELVVTGATATTTTEMESAADAGEILVSPDLASRLPRGAAGALKGPGVLLRWRRAPAEPVGPLFRRPVRPDVLAGCVPTVLRSHLDHGVAEPEHRVATVGFIKFKGVDAAMAAGGHDLVASGLEELITAVQAAVDPEGVTFLATDIDADGGKAILTTGVPGSQEDDEGRMLRAVRRIADAATSFPLKIGVNRGHVFAGEIGTEFRSTYTVMGDTVNLAARLMAAAPPGAVYAAPGVLDRSRTLFATEALEPFHVKGKAEPVQAYAVGAETGSRTTPTHRELPFTGRDDELATLRKAIDALDGGTGGAITVTGDTGFGKSRLVVESLTGSPIPTLTVRAEPYGATNPYWAFRDPLRSLLGIERGDQAEMAA
ncbi:MAG: adenylate/guanylate cyclase domain-containing protein, partial [Acidimicrobiia bacterium]